MKTKNNIIGMLTLFAIGVTVMGSIFFTGDHNLDMAGDEDLDPCPLAMSIVLL